MEDIHVPFSNSAIYLGVTLDRKLNWQEHIQAKIDKAQKLLQSITHLVSDNFGPKPELLIWAYTGVVRPALTYAAMNWGHAKCIMRKFIHSSADQSLLKGLEKLVTWRMERKLMANPNHPQQHGFQKGKGRESALATIVDYIEKAVFRK